MSESGKFLNYFFLKERATIVIEENAHPNAINPRPVHSINVETSMIGYKKRSNAKQMVRIEKINGITHIFL